MDNSTIIAIAISAFIIISGALLWYLNRERQRIFKKYGKPTLEIDFGRTFFYNNLELAIINGQEFKYSEIENYEVYKHSEVVDGEVKHNYEINIILDNVEYPNIVYNTNPRSAQKLAAVLDIIIKHNNDNNN